MKYKHILITGGAGFIGSAIASNLKKDDKRIIARQIVDYIIEKIK